MRKLFLILAIVLCSSYAYAQHALMWDDVVGEDGYIVYHKPYPAGYSYPANPAPPSLIQDMSTAVQINLPADTVEWNLPAADFTMGARYVFVVRATQSGSVSGESDYLCWTYPAEGQVIETEAGSGASIQINIYQKP